MHSAHSSLQHAHHPIHFEHPAAAAIRTNLSFEPKKQNSSTQQVNNNCNSSNNNDDHGYNNNNNNNSSNMKGGHKSGYHHHRLHDVVAEEPHDFSSDTWMSLLGLLTPIEFFVTVDSFPIWRRHVAWAKLEGHELRSHTTQRFSSNMVLLSLLLGTEMTFLLDNETRQALKTASYTSFVFWIGITIMISACITVIGLVATFTAWGMVSAISDANTHCLLRSSIGQYVTTMPARFVVASLYIFLLWLIMWIINLLDGGYICIVIILWVSYVFFQVVVSLSAFGRLIIHTGAMGNANVLDPEIERRLLPSGLHASLLIKAMHRKRACATAVSQYRMVSSHYEEDLKKSHVETPPIPNNHSNNSNYGSVASHTSPDEEKRQRSSSSALDESHSSASSMDDEDDLTTSRRVSVQDAFPRASILNRTDSKHLFEVVETVLSQCAASVDLEVAANIVMKEITHPGHRRTQSELDVIAEWEDLEREGCMKSNVADIECPADDDNSNADTGDPSDLEQFGAPDTTMRENEVIAPPFHATMTELMHQNTDPGIEMHSPTASGHVHRTFKEMATPHDATKRRRSDHVAVMSVPLKSTTSTSSLPTTERRRRGSLRRSLADFLRVQLRRASLSTLQQEWVEETDARDLYGAPPPEEIPCKVLDDLDQGDRNSSSGSSSDDDDDEEEEEAPCDKVVAATRKKHSSSSLLPTNSNSSWAPLHQPWSPSRGRLLESSFKQNDRKDVKKKKKSPKARHRMDKERECLLPKG